MSSESSMVTVTVTEIENCQVSAIRLIQMVSDVFDVEVKSARWEEDRVAMEAMVVGNKTTKAKSEGYSGNSRHVLIVFDDLSKQALACR